MHLVCVGGILMEKYKMTSYTYVEFMKSLGYNLIVKFDSHSQATTYKYGQQQKNKNIEYVTIENVYVWKKKYELWAKLKG